MSRGATVVPRRPSGHLNQVQRQVQARLTILSLSDLKSMGSVPAIGATELLQEGTTNGWRDLSTGVFRGSRWRLRKRAATSPPPRRR